MESWTEIKISVDAKDIDRASDIANVVVPYGIYIEDYTNLEQEVEDIAHIDLIDEDLLAKDRNKAFVHIYLEPDVSPSEAVAFLSERYNAEGIKHSIELLDCLEEDWRNNWKKYFNPIEVGEKLLIPDRRAAHRGDARAPAGDAGARVGVFELCVRQHESGHVHRGALCHDHKRVGGVSRHGRHRRRDPWRQALRHRAQHCREHHLLGDVFAGAVSVIAPCPST